MPPVLRRAPPHRPHLSAALATLLAGCGAAPPAATPAAPVAAAVAPAAAPGCMQHALVSLALPIEEGFAVEQPGGEVNAATADCVLGLFEGALKTPVAFDRDYARVFTFHEEDGALRPASLPRRAMQLFRLGTVGGAHVWLLRIDTGTEMEGGRYDVLLSTDRGDGALIDQLLVGAKGVLYRRDYDIAGPAAFAIREETGREAQQGPGYRARYRIADDGRFQRIAGEVVPPGSIEAEAASTADPPDAPLSGLSLESLPGGFGALAPIRALLFARRGVEEKAVIRLRVGATPAVLAIGLDGPASLATHVLSEVPGQAPPGHTLYRVSSLVRPGPAGVGAVELRDYRWEAAGNDGLRITLSLGHDRSRADGDSGTGIAAAVPAGTTTVVLRYDVATGALAPERTE